MQYILDENNNPVPEPDDIKWMRWFKQTDRTVKKTPFLFGTETIEVSTVFLSLPHISKEPGNEAMMLYETMVFADEAILKRLLELSEQDDRSILASFFGGVDIQRRYATRKEAEQGHTLMCEFIDTCMTAGLLHECKRHGEDEPLSC